MGHFHDSELHRGLNRPPLFMLFGEEAGFPPRDRWPFSHKVLCLDLACSGARQQSSDDTAFGKQLPDAGVATTESTENWMTHRVRSRLNRGTALLRLDLPTSRESKQGTEEIMMGLRNPEKKCLGLNLHDTTSFRFTPEGSMTFARFHCFHRFRPRPDQCTPEKKKKTTFN